MPIVFFGAPLRWFIRIGLAVFYGLCIFLHYRGEYVLTWIYNDHPYWTAVLIGITIMAFVPWGFFFNEKKAGGGEMPK